MPNRVYNRRVVVKVGRPGEDGREWRGGGRGELRIAFDIEKHAGADPNVCEVHIYNLAHESRAFIADGLTLIIEAGYVDGVDLLWRGEITDVIHRQQGTEWITQIESQDGLSELNAPANISFSAGSTPAQMAQELVDRFRSDGATGFLSDAINQGTEALTGLVSGGTIKDALDRLTRSAGLEFSVQDGALVIPDADGGTDEEVVHLTPTTGLVGSPERGSEGLEVRSKLMGKIKPHRRFVLESRYIRGVFVARRVCHYGDTYGDEWDTEIEASE